MSEHMDTSRYPSACNAEIARLERRLAELYAYRREMIIEMAADMTRREIAAYWNISNPRVTAIVNGGSKWRAPEVCDCPPDDCNDPDFM